MQTHRDNCFLVLHAAPTAPPQRRSYHAATPQSRIAARVTSTIWPPWAPRRLPSPPMPPRRRRRSSLRLGDHTSFPFGYGPLWSFPRGSVETAQTSPRREQSGDPTAAHTSYLERSTPSHGSARDLDTGQAPLPADAAFVHEPYEADEATASLPRREREISAGTIQ